MHTRILQCVCLAGCLFATGCANMTSIAPGTAASAVEASRGKPFRVWPETGGGTSWEYPYGPMGHYTYMVRVGADGRVSGVDQVLGWDTFARITVGMPITEVEHLLGRPYSRVTYPLNGQTAWAWRFVETLWRRCFFAYVAPDGKVTGTGARDEETSDFGFIPSTPC
ncbi:MAG: hypothetical protein IPO58_24230 [Betaproteobacteria bacterium]|nr:hypothetical protein [Betaproteobacteria bacterium]